MNFNAEKLSSKGRSRKNDFKQVSQKLRLMKTLQADKCVNELHEKVFRNINCIECANCCRGLGPRITRTDIERLASYHQLKPADFTEKYLKIDEDGDYVFKSMPCPFLQDDNLCSVYPSRPRACKEYPHTNQRNIKSIMHLCIKNSETCPAVFEIFDILHKTLK